MRTHTQTHTYNSSSDSSAFSWQSLMPILIEYTPPCKHSPVVQRHPDRKLFFLAFFGSGDVILIRIARVYRRGGRNGETGELFSRNLWVRQSWKSKNTTCVYSPTPWGDLRRCRVMLTVRPRVSQQRVKCRPRKFQKTAVLFYRSRTARPWFHPGVLPLSGQKTHK